MNKLVIVDEQHDTWGNIDYSCFLTEWDLYQNKELLCQNQILLTNEEVSCFYILRQNGRNRGYIFQASKSGNFLMEEPRRTFENSYWKRMRTMKSYFFPIFHYQICCKAKIKKDRIRSLYIWILFTIDFKICSLPLKDCFHW